MKNMKKRMHLITVLFSIMLMVCSCSGYLKADDNAGVANNGTETKDKDGGDARELILDGVTPGEISAIETAREDIINGDLTAAMIKLEQDGGYEAA